MAVPNVESLAGLGRLAELVDRAAIRILDLVVLVKDDDGSVALLEVDAIDGTSALGDLDADVGGMLSEHDIARFALRQAPPA